MGKRYFSDDKLGRKQYADFLNTIILNSDKYKRDVLEKSYVIAVDSSWGTGKTYFVDMFENYLMGYDEPNIRNTNSSYYVIRFDAWKSDFWSNAFEPFVSTILENDIFYFDIEAENAESLLMNLLKSSAIIAKGFVKKKIEDYVDIDSLEEAFQQSAESAKDFLLHNNPLFSQYKEFRDEIEEFKACLSNAVSKEKKIVIIVDELDRCRPTFAVQLLEIVKHLFDINEIVFIFMLDIEQLSYSIQTIYGHGMDATGYLCRFFDYISRMPQPNIRQYIENNMEGVLLYESCGDEDLINFIDFFTDVCEKFVLSLRDIDTVICSYKIMLDSFLNQYEYLDAHCQYLFYLILKYKDAEEFSNIFLKSKPSREIMELQFPEFPSIARSIKNTTQLIQNLIFEEDDMSDFYEIRSVYDEEIRLKSPLTHNVKVEKVSDFSFNDILFTPDFKKWEEIKYMKYGRYIHQQLEMFNFVSSEYTNEITQI